MAIHTQNHTITLGDGRKLGYAAYGVPTGQPVFFFHGSASSRLDHPLDEDILTRLNIRFISMDRPGNGLSDFQADRRLIDSAKDILQLADHLEIAQFHVLGHSAGGPHALACAHQLPERMIKAAVISSVAPMNRPHAYQGMPLFNRLLARSARFAPIFTHIIRWMTRWMLMGDFEKSSKALMSSIPEVDQSILYSAKNKENFINTIREGFRVGSRGVAQDDILINRAWGFELNEIRPQIDIWHGELDVNVPMNAAQYLYARLPHARVIFLPGEGHFLILKYWERIRSALVYPDQMEADQPGAH